MGLDAVELLLAVEESYDISIPDREAEKIRTVGELHAFVMTALRRKNRSNLDSQTVFYELRSIICQQISVKPELVVPDARFVEDLKIDQ